MESARYRGGTIWGKDANRVAFGFEGQCSSNKNGDWLVVKGEVCQFTALKFEIGGEGGGKRSSDCGKELFSALSLWSKDFYSSEGSGFLVSQIWGIMCENEE